MTVSVLCSQLCANTPLCIGQGKCIGKALRRALRNKYVDGCFSQTCEGSDDGGDDDDDDDDDGGDDDGDDDDDDDGGGGDDDNSDDDDINELVGEM